MRILVTGSRGFIGREVVRLLNEAGHEVHGSGRGAADDSRSEFHLIDLLEPGSPGRLIKEVRPDVLIHLAWDVSPGYWTSTANGAWVEASLALYRAFADAGGRKAVFAGTCAEYDWALDEVLSTATTRLEPATQYGQAKDRLRREIEAIPGGPSMAWGRVFWLYGPREASGRLVSDTIDGLKAGRPVATSEGLQSRDFLHVEDVASAFVEATRQISGPFNIGSGEAVEVRRVVDILARLSGRAELVDRGAIPSRPEPQRLVADIAALSASGWRPRWPLEEGLRDTWLRRQN